METIKVKMMKKAMVSFFDFRLKALLYKKLINSKNRVIETPRKSVM
jgi:hypothetical protein